MKTACEAGFAVYRDLESNRRYISGLFEGGADEIEIDDFDSWASTNLGRESVFGYSECVLHLHPNPVDGILGISEDDLRSLNSPIPGARGLRPIVAIGAVSEDAGYAVLLQQLRSERMCLGGSLELEISPSGLVGELLEACRGEYDWRGTREAWVESLSIPGSIRSALLRFSTPEGSRAVVHNPHVLGNFGYRASLPESF